MDVAKLQQKIITNKIKQTGQDRQTDLSENYSFRYSPVGDILHSLIPVLLV